MPFSERLASLGLPEKRQRLGEFVDKYADALVLGSWVAAASLSVGLVYSELRGLPPEKVSTHPSAVGGLPRRWSAGSSTPTSVELLPAEDPEQAPGSTTQPSTTEKPVVPLAAPVAPEAPVTTRVQAPDTIGGAPQPPITPRTTVTTRQQPFRPPPGPSGGTTTTERPATTEPAPDTTTTVDLPVATTSIEFPLPTTTVDDMDPPGTVPGTIPEVS